MKIALALILLIAAAPAADVTVGKEMNGRTVTLARGRTLAVRLRSNATTGYSWTLAAVPPVLVASGDSYVGPRDPVPGAGGEQLLRFRAVRRGGGLLRLAYRRSWEKGWPPAADTYKLNVQVR